MKLISLNVWGGKLYQPLIEFIKTYSLDTDIFCFQEIFDTKSEIKSYKNIRANLLSEIKNILPNFNYFYFPTLFGLNDKCKKVDFNLSHGVAVFFKKTITVDYHQNYFISRPHSLKSIKEDFSDIAVPLQVVRLHADNHIFLVFNFHGTPFPAPKVDTKQRINQSKYVKKILNYFKGTKILVGDFNLFPDTESIKLLEENMINLIKEYKIDRTRSMLSPFWGKEDFQKYADYTFVSKDVKVKSFKVPDVNISDHLPMILEFN